MTKDDPLPPPILRGMAPELPNAGSPKSGANKAKVPDEQLWSWVDRDAPELALHLDEHPGDRSRVDDLRRAIRAVSGSEREDRAPERIGPYPIKGRLGSGGMGVVFEAVQVRTNRRVAIKVIRGAWLDDERTRRLFFREAEVLGRLQHTGIAAIHDAGETKEGSPYFVMELIDGKPLDEWSAGQSIDSKLGVAIQIADAVDHAHEKGVIHRDLKPSNVLVTEDNEAKVLDFGLARIVDPSNNASLTAAMSGNVIGTVRYMSPEQARGLASKVTPASDVYSIGVLLYELVTGRLPHDFEGADLFECARRVAEDRIEPPSHWNGDISSNLDHVIQRSLAKDPASRYPSAKELREDLERALKGEPVKATAGGEDLSDLLRRFGKYLGFDVSRISADVASGARDVYNTKEGRKVREKARSASHRIKEAGIRTSKKLGLGASTFQVTWNGRKKVKEEAPAPSEKPDPKTIRLDLNPMLDAAAVAKKGVGVAARTGAQGARLAGRSVKSVLHWLRPWLWRAAIASIIVAAIGLAVAVQVEYDGNWDALFRDVRLELKGAYEEIKRELT